MVDAHVGADSSPESAGELRSAVGDDTVWYDIFADHLLEKHTCPFRFVNIVSAGYVNHHLR